MVEDILFPSGPPKSEADVRTTVEQYKLAVEIWDRVRARRQQANALYLSINSALIGATALQQAARLPLEYLCAVGLLTCLLWSASISNYRTLANDKFQIISRLEQLLPCAPFSAEATVIKDGKYRSTRRPFTWVERTLPIVFALLYVTLLLRSVLPPLF
jgi:hypothetical protein